MKIQEDKNCWDVLIIIFIHHKSPAPFVIIIQVKIKRVKIVKDGVGTS